MDDKIFVREPQQAGNKTQVVLMVVAAVLVLIGLVGVVAVLLGNNNNSTGNTTSPAAVTPPTTEPTQTPPTTTPVETPPTAPEPTPTPTPTTPPTGEAGTYTPPSDSTKINIYLPKDPETTNNPNQLMPVLRDKPASNPEAFAINQVITGPTAEEKAQGFQRPWAFSGTSKCDKNIGYKFETAGSTIKFTICKDYSGTKPEQFIEALNVTVTQLGKIKKVAVLNADGSCFNKTAGDTSCLN